MKIKKNTLAVIEFDSEDIETLKNVCEVVRRTMDQAWQGEQVSRILYEYSKDERIKLREIIYKMREIFNLGTTYIPGAGGFLPPFEDIKKAVPVKDPA